MTSRRLLCIHTITTKPWSLPEALEQYSLRGIGGVSIWQNAIEPWGVKAAARIIRDYPVTVVSYVRGGFFPSVDTITRNKAIEENKRLIDEANEIGAPLLVLVCGADPGQPLTTSRDQIRDAIEAILPHARASGVKLAIEPLHPMYADNRSAINTLKQANDMADFFTDPYVGVAVDVYHLWWDPELRSQIERCGADGHLLAFHICDWKTPTTDLLNDRGLMGDGCIPIREITSWVKGAGFDGFIEVEIFSDHYWSMDQSIFLDKIIESYHKLY